MATKPKAILSTHDGREASPITKASNVLFENGQTAQDILNDRQDAMISPVIENSSSMFKVGQGDNVDYSSNVVNGAYESMVLKGKSMVNCIQESSSQDVVLPYAFEDGQSVTINDTKESGALSVELKGQTLVNLLKVNKDNYIINNPQNWYVEDGYLKCISTTGWHTVTDKISSLIKSNTKYLIFVEIKENTLNIDINFDGYGTTLGTSSTFLKFESNEVGTKKVIVTTPSTIDSTKNGLFRMPINVPNDNSTLKFRVMAIEYQEGMESWDIPYFESMQSVKVPVLKTTGKNLFNYKSIVNTNKGVTFTFNNSQIDCSGTYTSSNLWTVHSLSTPIKLRKGDYYYSISGIEQETVYFTTSDGEKVYTGRWTFNTDIDLVSIHLGLTKDKNYDGVTFKIQIEEGNAATSYEPHKSNILSTSEEVVLRRIGDVQDTLNCLTGEVTERIGEIVLDGSEDWSLGIGFSDNENGNFECKNINIGNRYNKVISTHFNYDSGTDDRERVRATNSNYIVIYINKTRLESPTVDGFKKWLITQKNSGNPVKVQYQLLEKSIKTVDLEVVDQNGNVIPTLKSWNTTTHIYSEIPENSLYPILSHSNPSYPVILKPNTKYSIVANSYSNNHTNSAINFNLGGATASTVVGNRVTTITTPSTLSNELLTMSGRGNKLNNVMVIEGDVVGDEPYFEGICDCKSPILSNTGKNLFDLKSKLLKGEYTYSNPYIYVPISKGVITNNNTTTVSVSCKNLNGSYSQITPKNYYTSHFSTILSNNSGDVDKSVVIRSQSVCHQIAEDGQYYFSYTDSSNSESKMKEYLLSDNFFIQIEHGETQATTCEPYKSNTTTFEQNDGKTIVLRSLPNGVRDTLNVETGEYVQRIGEVVLDGSEDWIINNLAVNNKVITFYGRMISDAKVIPNVVNYTSDKIASLRNELWASDEVEGFMFMNNKQLAIKIKRETASTSEELVTYLSQNPITVQYELETPIVSTIDMQGFPYAYTNGHVQLSSGSIEQSLTPTVEYSVATNRNGQIRSNQKMVERHQKQLDQLQAIILANLVNSQYNQTLTTLKYELSRV